MTSNELALCAVIVVRGPSHPCLGGDAMTLQDWLSLAMFDLACERWRCDLSEVALAVAHAAQIKLPRLR
jgi:hypothetical protein